MVENKLLDVEIVTPKEILFKGLAQSVTVPGSKGAFQILNMHAPIVSTLDIGLTKIVDESNKEHWFATGPGFTEVHKNMISILVESAQDAEQIDIEKAKAGLASAKEAFAASRDSELLKSAVLEAENKIKAAEKAKL